MPKNIYSVSEVYKVQSQSDPKLEYSIRNVWQCSCKGWVRAGKECKHIREVKQKLIKEINKDINNLDKFFSGKSFDLNDREIMI